MADFDLNMTLYDANKQIMKTMAPVSKIKMNLDFANLGAWMSKYPNAHYFMLLCKERSDYTMFHLNNYNYSKATKEVREVLEERGTLLGINYVHGEDAYECWIREEGENPQVYMFMLFQADWMVVEVE